MARDKKRRGDRRNLVLLRAPGRRRDRRRGRGRRAGGGDRGAARMSGTRNRIEVLHGVNLDMLGKRDAAALRDAHAGRAGGAHPPLVSRARARGDASSTPMRRASSSSACTRRRRWPTGCVLNPGAWTHYSYAIRDALEIAGMPGDRGPPLGRRQARGVAAPVGDRRPRAPGGSPARAPDGYREALEMLARRARRRAAARGMSAWARRADRLAALVAGAGHRPAARQQPRRTCAT